MRYFVNKLIQIGKLLSTEGLVDARAGNISVRIGNKILITRKGSNLRMLTPYDLIVVGIDQYGILDDRASSELLIHREIYRKTSHNAVVHAHPVNAVKLSLSRDFLEFLDSEGKSLLGSVKVIEDYPSGSAQLAYWVSEELKSSNLVIVRGHGVFSAGENIMQAYSIVSILEHSCKIMT